MTRWEVVYICSHYSSHICSSICVITIIVQKKVKEEMTRWEGVGKWFHCSSAPVLSVDCHGSRCIFTFKIHICHGTREVNSVEIYQSWLLQIFSLENISRWLLSRYMNLWRYTASFLEIYFIRFLLSEFYGATFLAGIWKVHDGLVHWINPKMVQSRTLSMFCEKLSFTILGLLLLARIWCLKVPPPEQMCPQPQATHLVSACVYYTLCKPFRGLCMCPQVP